jgi:hypothetical protein
MSNFGNKAMTLTQTLGSLHEFKAKLPPGWQGFVWEWEDYYTDKTGLQSTFCLYLLFQDERSEFRLGVYPRLSLYSGLDSDTACRLLQWSHNDRYGIAVRILDQCHRVDTEAFYALAVTYRCETGRLEFRL